MRTIRARHVAQVATNPAVAEVGRACTDGHGVGRGAALGSTRARAGGALGPRACCRELPRTCSASIVHSPFQVGVLTADQFRPAGRTASAMVPRLLCWFSLSKSRRGGALLPCAAISAAPRPHPMLGSGSEPRGGAPGLIGSGLAIIPP